MTDDQSAYEQTSEEQPDDEQHAQTPAVEDQAQDLPAVDEPVVPEAVVEIPLNDVSGRPDVVEQRLGQFGVHGSPDVSGYGGLVTTVVLPGASERPYGGYFDEVADDLANALGGGYDAAITKVVVDRGQLTFHVAREHLVAVCQVLRDDPLLRFELSLGCTGIHWPGDVDNELHVSYQLRSLTHNRLIQLETTCPDSDPHVPSTTAVYPTNDWHERETYDFFGVIFDGHPHLPRSQRPDDWPGHPQRKDYPLGGIPVEYKGAVTPPPDERRWYS